MSSFLPSSPLPKKRRLRKGTRSCWECKRRKARCIFLAPDDATCTGCRKRGAQCISQEDEDVAPSKHHDDSIRVSEQRIQHIEAMLNQLVDNQSEHTGGSSLATMNKDTLDVTDSSSRKITARSTRPHLMLTKSTIPRSFDTTLSHTLHSMLPSLEECENLCSSTKLVPCFFQQMLTRNYLVLSQTDSTPLCGDRVAALPSRNAHPVLIAQKLLMMACLFHYAPHDQMSSIRPEECRRRAEYMARGAIDLVTTKDGLIRSAEGLECLMLEVTFHANFGSLQDALSTVRRALVAAQLLGIHRATHQGVSQIDAASPGFDAAYMWFRIVYVDRFLCLALGLPQGSADVTFASIAALASLTAEERLEREHCTIAARILHRNENQGDPLDTTDMIDSTIQKVASSLPSSWWLIPTLSSDMSGRDMFLATTRLVNQLFHFNLISQTHLPFLLNSQGGAVDEARRDYSSAACATASREILHRYLAFRTAGVVVHSSYFVHFFALIAAITLLLTHLDRHWRNEGELNVLSHMRSNDRAMVEQATGFMKDITICKGSEMLEHILAVEKEAFDSHSVGCGEIVKNHPDTKPFLELQLPYFGVLRVSSAKVCFRRALDIEDISLGVKREIFPSCSDVEARGDSAPAGEDWLNADLQSVEAYNDVEGGFFDGFSEFLENAPT